MMQQILKLHNIVKVHTEVKFAAREPEGSITKVALELGATWVILDRCLKKEGDSCMKQLINCNIILIDCEIQKDLRSVNLFKAEKLNEGDEFLNNPTVADMLGMFLNDSGVTTQSSSLGGEDRISKTDTSSHSNTRTNDDNFHQTKLKKADIFSPLGDQYFHHQKGVESMYRSSTTYSKSQPLSKMVLRDLEAPSKSPSSPIEENSNLSKSRSDINRKNGIKTAQVAPRKSIDSRLSRQKPPSPNQPRLRITRKEFNHTNEFVTIDRMSSIRKAMSVSLKQPSIPPPLCSVCKHNAPVFGRAPRKFTYKEIEGATDGFSRNNFLGKGGFGHASILKLKTV